MRPYTPTAEIVEAFTEGDCWYLALTLHEMTGLPMVFANPMPSDPDYWEHVGLQISANRILDIQGVHTNMAWRRLWAGNHKCTDGILFRTQDEDYISYLLSDQDRIYYRTDARRPARRLLETYAPNLINKNAG